MNKEHYYFIDILRIVAIVAVLTQHAASAYIDICTNNHISANIFRSVTRWNILIFVMITGYLFLSRDISISTMWNKYIRRIVITFSAWSGVYTLYNLTKKVNRGGYTAVQLIKETVGDYVSGGTRVMWYLVMLIALYAFMPLIRCLIKSMKKNELYYSLCLTGTLTLVFPSLMLIGPINTVLGLDMGRMQGVFDSVYLFYAVYGYVWIECSLRGLNKRIQVLVFSLGIASLFGNALLGIKTEEMIGTELITNMMICSMLVLIALKAGNAIKEKAGASIVRKIADCTFGIYLVHTLFNEIMKDTMIASSIFSVPILFAIPLYTAVLFVTSFLLVMFLKKNKYLKKVT